jgi:hypothetical protein
LDNVPDGKWICPDCASHGETLETLAAKEKRYVESERSRPDLELPGRSRVAKARRLAEEWHGAPVKQVNQGKTRLGRVHFQDILKPKWFRIDWADLEKIDEADLPPDFPSRPGPVIVAAMLRHIPSTNGPGPWRKVPVDDIGLTDHDWTLLDTLLRTNLIRGMPAVQLQTDRTGSRPYFDLGPPDRRSPLQQVPASDTLRAGLQYLLFPNQRGMVLVTPHMALNPDFMDIAMLYADQIVCTKVRLGWLRQGLLESSRWFTQLRNIGQLLVVQVVNPPPPEPIVWLFAFPHTPRRKMLRVDIPGDYVWIFYDATHHKVNSMSVI